MNDGKRRIWGDELWVYVDEGKVEASGVVGGVGVGRRAQGNQREGQADEAATALDKGSFNEEEKKSIRALP